MEFGDAGDDGQPEAAAWLVALIEAVEAAQYGFAFVDGYARAAIGDR